MAVVAPASSVATLGAVAQCNAQHMEYMDEVVKEILKHSLVRGIDKADARDQSAGGRHKVLEPEFVQKALASNKEASGGGSVFWANLGLDAATSHTPIKTRKCQQMADKIYGKPRTMLGAIVCAVPPSWMAPGTRFEFKTDSLRRISPPESLHALLLAVHRDVVANELDSIGQHQGVEEHLAAPTPVLGF
ncbi:sinIM [Symbiodinium sp. CCMP2592]|nr:sinIM [Symbiodinium sp. CCMP2592]